MCPFWSLLRLVFLLALVSVTREQETGPPIIPSPITNTLPSITTSPTITSTPRTTTIILTRSSSTQAGTGMGTTSTRAPVTSTSTTVSDTPSSVSPLTTSTSANDSPTPTSTIIPNSSVDPTRPWMIITFAAVGIAFLVVEYV
ncbi:hypothetical protein OPQ81_009956 [Rhizoctonia solani]|nr:hypothetical protein OPQ81_009956 [Rhizoctonia solani]